MVSVFDSVSHKQVRTIYVIGNGFDLAHQGIDGDAVKLYRINYSDYKSFLNNQGSLLLCPPMTYDDLFSIIEAIPTISKDWSNFEEALSELDPKYLLSHFESRKFKYTKPCPLNEFLSCMDESIQQSFEDWVNSVVLGDTPVFDFDKRSFFISFNYTETLEKVYNIDPSSIIYIHRKRHNGIGRYVFGHSVDRDELFKKDYYLDSDNPDIFDIRNSIANWKKDYQSDELLNKLSGLDGVGEIKIIGHSMSIVDKPYFDIIRNQFPQAHWTRYCYDVPNRIKERQEEAERIHDGITIKPDEFIRL